ncbi:TPA: molecular chaperone [Aeromonas dhakensis]|uniref:fimbria/pilus periplasmic chaperone n=1 Tax=Aeromonas dhakensis TaxID=196024 RepID=UPI00288E1F18|nr:molecular chaperone [Aeromonas dhakensis]
MKILNTRIGIIRPCSTLLLITSLSVAGMDIGPITIAMEPQQTLITRTIKNNGTSTKTYQLETQKISDPTSNGKLLTMSPGELLYTPKRFFLHAGQTQNVKIYYKGPADEQERYYQVTFIESPAAQPESQVPTTPTGMLEMNVALQSILVVRPRHVKFEYVLDEVSGNIRNSGNTFFEFMVKQDCTQPDSQADSKYLLPGEIHHNEKIKNIESKLFIIYASRFIPLRRECA